METNEKNAVIKALVECQANVGGAVKSSKNPHFGSKYADLSSVMEACADALKSSGLAVCFEWATNEDGGITGNIILYHVSGQWLAFQGPLIKLDKPNAHGVGSAMTYFKRYMYQSVLGIASEDDDGNEATKQATPAKATVKAPEPDYPDPVFSIPQKVIEILGDPVPPQNQSMGLDDITIKKLTEEIWEIVKTWDKPQKDEVVKDCTNVKKLATSKAVIEGLKAIKERVQMSFVG